MRGAARRLRRLPCRGSRGPDGRCAGACVGAAGEAGCRGGRFWPVRRYPWGNCEALSSVHSDLPALKRLLFEARPEHPVTPAPVCR